MLIDKFEKITVSGKYWLAENNIAYSLIGTNADFHCRLLNLHTKNKGRIK